MKVGLVLEGGGMRGMFTAGALDVLMDNNIMVDGIVGVSAGALFGANFFSGQKGRVIRYSKKYAKDKRYISIRNLILTGNAVSKRFAYYKVQKEYDPFDNETFKKVNKPFWAVATNVKTGKPEYLEIKDAFEDIEKLRATSALPLSSRIIKVDGCKYMDGAFSDALPINFMKKKGFDKLIIILTQPIKYRKKQMAPKKLKMVRFKYHRYKNFLKAIDSWPKRYNKTVEKIIDMENKKEIFVIRPHKKIWTQLIERDTDKLQSFYDMGVQDTNKIINDLKKYLDIL